MCQCPSREEHREVLHSCARREEFRLTRKLKAGGLRARLMDRAGDHGIDLARERHLRASLQRSHRSPGSVQRGNSRRSISALADEAIFKATVQFSRRQRRADDFRTDSRAIAEGNPDDSRTAARVQISRSLCKQSCEVS
jgi:hypothetical protein